MAKIAFIGLGHMGGGMAPNLAKAGHEVRAFDLSEEALARAIEQGCGRAGSTEEAVAVVNGRTGGREAHLLRWSLVPSYAKDLKGPPMFNARAETLTTKAPFKTLVGKPRNRCLIIADGFYEWLRPEDKKAPRVPFRFTVDGGAPFAFAGLWCWTKLDGEWLASCTIITTRPNEKVARLHDRMPVILPDQAAEEAWLDHATPAPLLQELLLPLPDAMTARPGWGSLGSPGSATIDTPAPRSTTDGRPMSRRHQREPASQPASASRRQGITPVNAAMPALM